MNNLLEYPVGIDDAIQDIQTTLYDELVDKWGIKKIDGYGRVYKNLKEGQVIPEVYISSESDYRSVLYNNQSCFFFIDSNNHNGNGFEFSTELTIVFMLNLKDISKKDKERIDEKVFMDAVNILRESFEGVFIIENHLKEIDTVLRDFDTSKIEENDMQPLHVFGIKGTLEYFINDNSC